MGPAVVAAGSNGIGYAVGAAQGAFGAGTGVLLGKYFSAGDNYLIDAQEMGPTTSTSEVGGGYSTI